MDLEIGIQNLHSLEYGSYTEAGTGERFVACYGEIVKFVEDTEKWKVFDNETNFWRELSEYNVIDMVKAIADKCEAELVDVENADTVKEMVKYIKAMRSLRHVKNALEFAKAAIVCKQEDFDANPRYLGMAGGKVLDLFECKVVDGCKDFMITKCLHGGIHSPISDEFYQYINTLIKDAEVREYVQKYLGSSLLGFRGRSTADKRALFLDSSEGNTGKSSILTLLEYSMGEYYKGVDINLLTEPIKDANRPNPMLAQLQGCRIVGISEVAKGAVFQDDNFKRLTGNDSVYCRFPYDKKIFHYRPDFRLLVVSNFLPVPQTIDDMAFKLRLRRYTFDRELSAEEMDTDIDNKFRKQEFIDDFLSWLVEGCKKYIDGGKMLDDYKGNNLETSNLPSAMKKAIGQYIGDYDVMGDFFHTFYKITGNEKDVVGLREMYDTWVQYSNDKRTGYYSWREMARDSFIKRYKLQEAERVLIIDDSGKVSSRAGIKGIAAYNQSDAIAQTKKSSVFDVPKRSKGRFEIVS